MTGLINNPEVGGISGLVQSFKEKGLSEVVGSWISTGKNLPITADQIQSVLGNEKVQQIAGKLGIPMDQVSSGLAQLLPQVIDKLTPDGKLPTTDTLMQGLNTLRGSLPKF